MGTCFKIQYTVHMALASFVRDGQLPTFTNDLFHCNFHAEQNVKGESRNGMYMNSVLIDLGIAIRYIKNSFQKSTYRKGQ